MPNTLGRKRCFKGKSCGHSCIYRGKTCLIDLNLPLSSSLGSVRGELTEQASEASKMSKVDRSGDVAQSLALEIHRKRRAKEDYSQEWNRLVSHINSLQGDAKRDATIKANAAIGKRLRINVNHGNESEVEAAKAGRKFLRQFNSLDRAVELVRRYDILLETTAKRVTASMTSEQISQMSSKLLDLNARKYRAEKRLEGIMADVRSKMLQTNLTDKQVKDLVSRVWTQNTSEETRSHMAEFIRMFNGRGFTDLGESSEGKSVRSVSETTDRAHARLSKGIVRTSGERSTTFHEIAHIVEGQRPWMARYAVQWRDGKAYDNIQDIRRQLNKDVPPQGFYKTGPTTSAPLIRLKDIFAGSKYDESELAVVDKFVHKYMGKVYQRQPWLTQKSTEVWSMAMEQFASPQTMATLYRTHPELFEIVAGLAVSP